MSPKTARRLSTSHCPTGHRATHNPLFAGLVSGAQVLTLKGELPVEALRAGDCVLTRRGAVPIARIDVISVITPTVYVIAGSLSHNRPDNDAFLTADQMVQLRDWRALAFCGKDTALVQARDLIDGEFVRNMGQQVVTLYRIFCSTPQVFYAEGLELGTADMTSHNLTHPAS